MIHHQRRHSIHPHRVTTESLFLFRFVPNFTTNFVPKGVQQIKNFQPLLENPLKSNGIYQYIHPISRKRGLRKQIQDKGQIKKRKKKGAKFKKSVASPTMKMKFLLFRTNTIFSSYIPFQHMKQNQSLRSTDWNPNLQRTWQHWPRIQNANGYQRQHTKLNLFIITKQNEKEQ